MPYFLLEYKMILLNAPLQYTMFYSQNGYFLALKQKIKMKQKLARNYIVAVSFSKYS